MSVVDCSGCKFLIEERYEEKYYEEQYDYFSSIPMILEPRIRIVRKTRFICIHKNNPDTYNIPKICPLKHNEKTFKDFKIDIKIIPIVKKIEVEGYGD